MYTFEGCSQNDPDLTQPRGLFAEGLIKNVAGKLYTFFACD